MTEYFNPRTKAWESKEEMEARPMDQAGETVLAIWDLPGKGWEERYIIGVDLGAPDHCLWCTNYPPKVRTYDGPLDAATPSPNTSSRTS